MESLQSGGKMLIPSRPYNPQLGSGNPPIVQAPFEEEKVMMVKTKNNLVNSTPKMNIPIPKVNNPVKPMQKIENPDRQKVEEIRKNLTNMRNTIKSRVKTMLNEAKDELDRIDNIENSVLAAFFPQEFTQMRTNTNHEVFFQEAMSGVLKKSVNPVSRPNVELNIIEPNVHIRPNTPSYPIEKHGGNDMNASFSSINSTFSLPSKVDPDCLLISLANTQTMYSKDLTSIHNLSIPNVVKGMGILVINSTQVLIAGGPKGVAFYYYLTTNGIRNLPKMLVKKNYFAMSFIGKCPAIIGGLDLRPSKTVEILNGNVWEKSSPLVYERSHGHAIKHEDSTYVFGGVTSGISTTIEKYVKDWTVLTVELPSKIRNFGLVSYGKNIILLGGEKEGSKSVHVLNFNTVNNTFEKTTNLQSQFSTINSSSLAIIQSSIYLLDIDRSVIIRYVVR